MLRPLLAADTRMRRFITFITLIAITLLLPQLGFAQSRVSGGANFTLVVTDSGTVWSFGNNSNGQLGLGGIIDQMSPKQIPGLSDVVAVAAGGFHALVLST